MPCFVHRQNSSHVAAEPLTANENVVQGAHRNTPRASLCAVESTLLFRLMQISSLRPCSPVPGTAGPMALTLHLSRVHCVSRYLHPPQRYLANAWDFLSTPRLFPRAPKSSASAGSVGADPPHCRNKPANQLSSVSQYGATVSSWRHNG